MKVDAKKCIGCGACVSVCPDVFDLRNGKASVKKGKENTECKEARTICPVGAIS